MKFRIVNFQAHRISGWVSDPEAAQSKTVLDLMVAGRPVASLSCTIFRDELSAEEFENRNIGFRGNLPAEFWTGEEHQVSLVHRASGTVLEDQRIPTTDARLPEGEGLSGDFTLTARGQLAGWAAADGSPTRIRVLLDGEQFAQTRATAQSLPWKRGRVKLQGPFGHLYGAQLPPELFDDEEHRVQVFAQDAAGAWVPMLNELMIFALSRRDQAEREVQRIAESRADTSSAWLKKAKVKKGISVKSLEATSSYARLTLAGEASHRRAVLRLGDTEAVLHAITPPEEAGRRREQVQSYAGELPADARFSGSLKLYQDGEDLESTYDVHMGDETGRRPEQLPEEIFEDTEGAFLASPAVLDGGALAGWAAHTAAVEAPVDLVLEAITPDGPVELARTQTTIRNKFAKLEAGLRQAGYTLFLSPEVLQERVLHLRLSAHHIRGTALLWEERNFHPSDDVLLKLALEASASRRATGLVANARAAGRQSFVESFFVRFAEAKSDVTLTDLEDAIIEYRNPRPESLEPSSGAIWYWVHELRANSGRIHWFTENAIRNRNGGARDILAYAASKGRYDFDQLHGILESYRAPLFCKGAEQMLAGDHWKAGMLSLARFLFAAPRDETDHLDALTLYSMVESWRGLAEITGPDRAFYGDLLGWRREFAESSRVLAEQDPDDDHDYSQHLLGLNALNPHTCGETSAQHWLDRFNALLETGGAAPVQLEQGELSFYRVTSDLPAAEVGERAPLVSVLMPIYEPSDSTDVAVDSLLKQTWRNLEIIMVDDCSPAVDAEGNPSGHRQRLERLAAQDDRIRLVLNEDNRGAYSVRNEGLDLARGELITIADKDDWHHPQQIELQVRDLLAHPEKVANMTNWVRVDPQLNFMLRSATGRVFYPSMPSLMFRRDPVFAELGYWDTVRKSGDSEFKSRIENHYGITIEPIVQAPLAFALMEGGNLTQDDMGVGYLAPDRRAYLRAYKSWHRKIRDEGESPFMPKAPEQRRFVAPPAYLPGARKDEPAQYDVVFASEFGFLAGNSTSLFTEISVCLNAGLRVGVIPFQNGLIPSAAKRQFNQKVDELVLTGQIDRLSLETAAETDLLVIRWPTAVQTVPDKPAALCAQRAVVVSNHPPFEPSGERRSYDIGTVTRNIKRLFGLRPLWAPQSEQIGQMLEPLMPAADLADFSWKGIIRIKEEARRNRVREGRPVIGRHARDDAAKWPSDRDVFQKVYPTDGSADVCILGGTKTPAKKGYLPRNLPTWEVYAFNEIEVDEYLREKIDFFVYFHSDGWLEAFGMAILEAMSYGVVCVLPRHFQPVFKDAAVYAEPEDVQATVQHLWQPERYREQQEKALRFIEDECTPEAYIRRVQRLGVRAGTTGE